jgi:hypothetical protein
VSVCSSRCLLHSSFSREGEPNLECSEEDRPPRHPQDDLGRSVQDSGFQRSPKGVTNMAIDFSSITREEEAGTEQRNEL